jgi:hypothetical protein
MYVKVFYCDHRCLKVLEKQQESLFNILSVRNVSCEVSIQQNHTKIEDLEQKLIF